MSRWPCRGYAPKQPLARHLAFGKAPRSSTRSTRLPLNTPLAPAGARLALDNFFNIAAVLFMWCMIPAFGAAAFVPSLVLGALAGVKTWAAR